MHKDEIDRFYSTLGQRVRSLRLNHPDGKMNQGELAAKVSLTRASIANIETGRQRVSAHFLAELANALKVPLTELVPSSELKTTSDHAVARSKENEILKDFEDDTKLCAWIESYIPNR